MIIRYLRLFVFIFLFYPLQNSAQKISNQLDQYLELIRPEFSGQKALETTAYVSDLWRTPGSIGFDSSIYYVQRILDSSGYQLADKDPNSRLSYRLERYPLRQPAWTPVAAKVYLSDNTKPLLDFSSNRNMIAINSFSTPISGVEAEVVYLKSCEVAAVEKLDLEGKIVMADCHSYALYKLVVEKKGALGILSYQIPNYNQPKKFQNSIPFTSIPFNSKLKPWAINLSYAARTALLAQLEKGSLKIKVQIETKIYPSEELALVAEIRGSKKPEERFVFSAHVQEPGANDNASGVGALAEMARVAANLVKKGSISPDRTLTFLWGIEIRSTRRYIQQDSTRAKGILWGMSLDMVGEDTKQTGGTFLIEKMPDPSAIWTRGGDKHTEWGASEVDEKAFNPHYFNDFIEFVCRKQAAAANWTVNTNPFEGGSDHQPFLDAQIPGLLLWHFTDVFYHTDADRIDKVSPITLANVGISALSSAIMLCNGSENTARDVLKITEHAALKRLKIEGGLSKKAILSRKNIADERAILWSWGYWYARTLPKIKDILMLPPSKKLTKQLEKSVKKVGKTTIKEMKKLD